MISTQSPARLNSNHMSGNASLNSATRGTSATYAQTLSWENDLQYGFLANASDGSHINQCVEYINRSYGSSVVVYDICVSSLTPEHKRAISDAWEDGEEYGDFTSMLQAYRRYSRRAPNGVNIEDKPAAIKELVTEAFVLVTRSRMLQAGLTIILYTQTSTSV